MKCPFCASSDTHVLDSRVLDDGDSVRRRRRCENCDKRFTTYERVELPLPMVVKRNGSRMDFDVRKVRASMMLALRKRDVSALVLDQAISAIQETLLTGGMREITSERIGELVLEQLKSIDKVAYVRFASVYKQFNDIKEFNEIIRDVIADS